MYSNKNVYVHVHVIHAGEYYKFRISSNNK